MERKLVKQGNGALTITLPNEWLIKNNLRKGDNINILESGKDLILSSKNNLTDNSIDMEISTDKPFFKRYVRTAYVLGYNKITIFSSKQLPYLEINEALSSLIGFEITEQSSKKCVIESMVKYDDAFDNIIRRIFFMVSTMFKEIILCLEKKDIVELKGLSHSEKTVNRFVDLSLRFLNQKGYTDFKKTPYIYHFLTGLEACADHLRDFCLNSKGNTDTIFMLDISSYYEDIMHLFFRYDMKKINKIKEKRLKLITHSKKQETTESQSLYALISELHQLEVALDPLNN
jgi:phosphate uptake regulator